MVAQSMLCQMPYSFSRIALALGRWAAWVANNRENVVDIRNPS